MKSYDLMLDENKIPYLKETGNYDWDNRLSSIDEVATLVSTHFPIKDYAEEKVLIIGTDAKLVPKSAFWLSHGGMSCSYIDRKSVSTRLLLSGCTSFFMVHNHPSGDTTPSPEDIKVTKSLDKMAKVLDLRFVDSVIIGCNAFSVKENCM